MLRLRQGTWRPDRLWMGLTRLSDGEGYARGDKIVGMKSSCLPASLRMASALGLLFGSVAFGQSPVSLSGQAVDATGRPIPHAVVRLISDTTMQPGARPWRYTLMGDALGKFSQEGIAPGAYLVMLFTDGKAENILQSVLLKPGDTSVLEVHTGLRPQVQVAGTGGTLSMVGRRSTSVQTR